MIVHSNRQRVKTTEQKTREYKVLKRIENERAKARQAEQAKRNQPQSQNVENVPPLEEGRARDLAAAQLGISGKTAEKIAEVVDKIDELEAAGDTEQAADLRNTVNRKGGCGGAG